MPQTIAQVNFYRRLGSQVRIRREAIGMSQDLLAASIGLTRTSIVNIEAGRQRTTIHGLMFIAKRLKCSASEILRCAE